VVGGSSMFASPAFAVDRDMVGNEREGALIWGDGLLRRYCCCAATAANNVSCAVSCSLLLGEEEKNWVNRFPLEVDGLRGETLSVDGVATALVVELANGFRGSL
jgi:hypothetical protein